MDISLALITGQDIPIPECQLTLHQPTIKEIGLIGEDVFFIGVQTLSLYKSMFVQDKTPLETLSSFQIFMTIMREKETIDKKQAVQQLMLLMFPDYKVMFTPRTMLLQGPQSSATIDESNFEALQETVRKVFCTQTTPMDQQAFNPGSQKAKEIADKLMKGRQTIAAEKQGAASSSVFSQYLSSLTIGLHLSLVDLREYTMYQIFDLVDRLMLYINWDIDLKVRMAGGSPDKPADNWMKNIH